MAGHTSHISLAHRRGFRTGLRIWEPIASDPIELMALGSEEAEIFCLDSGMERTGEEHSEGAHKLRAKPEGCGAMKAKVLGHYLFENKKP